MTLRGIDMPLLIVKGGPIRVSLTRPLPGSDRSGQGVPLPRPRNDFQ